MLEAPIRTFKSDSAVRKELVHYESTAARITHSDRSDKKGLPNLLVGSHIQQAGLHIVTSVGNAALGQEIRCWKNNIW